jgi:hypothetical protein
MPFEGHAFSVDTAVEMLIVKAGKKKGRAILPTLPAMPSE